MNQNIQTLTDGKLVSTIDHNIFNSRFFTSYEKIIGEVQKNYSKLKDKIPDEDELNREEYISDAFLRQLIVSDTNIDRSIHGHLKIFLNLGYSRKLLHHLASTFPKHSIKATGGFLYEAGDFMGWHTNNNLPGYRMYITHCDEHNKSVFKYLDPRTNEVVSYVEPKGFTIKLFKITTEETLWHCVSSDCNRYSIGFYILDNIR